MFGPNLRGERIRLEPPRLEDVERRLTWYADLEVAHFHRDPFVPSAAGEEASYHKGAADEHTVLWSIVVDDRAIGLTWLTDIDWIHQSASQGMFIGERSEWGKGYGSEAVRLRTAYAFRELGLRRLETSSLLDNVGMHRALQRSGFREIGRRTERYYVDGAWQDELLFELLRADWEGSAAEGS